MSSTYNMPGRFENENDLQSVFIDKKQLSLQLLGEKIHQLQTKRRGIFPVKRRRKALSVVGDPQFDRSRICGLYGDFYGTAFAFGVGIFYGVGNSFIQDNTER